MFNVLVQLVTISILILAETSVSATTWNTHRIGKDGSGQGWTNGVINSANNVLVGKFCISFKDNTFTQIVLTMSDGSNASISTGNSGSSTITQCLHKDKNCWIGAVVGYATNQNNNGLKYMALVESNHNITRVASTIPSSSGCHTDGVESINFGPSGSCLSGIQTEYNGNYIKNIEFGYDYPALLNSTSLL
eukprot:277104_1